MGGDLSRLGGGYEVRMPKRVRGDYFFFGLLRLSFSAVEVENFTAFLIK
jgi:hypothetical protein